MLSQANHELSARAEKFFQEREYQASALVYQELIESTPSHRPYYWKLGLSLLLQGEEAEAQFCWMSVLMEGDETESKVWANELTRLLNLEARCQSENGQIRASWLIRHHAREVEPENIDNLLSLIGLCLQLGEPCVDLINQEDQGLIQLLQSRMRQAPSKDLFLSTLSLILKHYPIDDTSFLLVKLSFDIVKAPFELQNVLGPVCIHLAEQGHYAAAAALAEMHLMLEPDNMEFLSQIGLWHSSSGNLERAIETAKTRLSLSTSPIEEVFSRHLLTKILLGSGGHWQAAYDEFKINKVALYQVNGFRGELERLQLHRLIATSFYAPYFKDSAAENRRFCNHVASLFSQEAKLLTPPDREDTVSNRRKIDRVHKIGSPQKLKVGYLSHCLKRHSVGWIARWLITNHDRESVETYGYLLNFNEGDTFQNWYAHQFSQTCRVGIDCPNNGIDIAKQIEEDQIDILVDLDSVTFDLSCEVLTYKPAPIQLTWLGWDASGIPEIDYYIADPYVLPDNAQEYYREKIWRLPQTYVAVSGFEVSTSTINRRSLSIPEDAITYLTAQGGFKRNPDCMMMQLSIIKHVKNSCLLIKGSSDSQSIQKLFQEIAQEMGVEQEQLIFLPIVETEEEHRANLRVADIVLDTFPYNGATTTLEALWMEIPLVTLVGQQFSARNSYTMLKNVGVDEGIAWSEEEYIGWGVRLGTDVELRQEVMWKLRKSKQSSALWDMSAFTGSIETAYKEMWKDYCLKTAVQ